jgi:radical SAM superfamily enzyme YgiQ (UPF0313 family)
MKITFVIPNSPFLIDEKVYPSLGVLYLSSYLKKHGFEDIDIIDLDLDNKLPNNIDSKIVGFYSNTPQFPIVIRLVNEIKKINKDKGAIYVVGGPHVSGKPVDALEDFDLVVVGEGEQAILEIAKKVDMNQEFSERIIHNDFIKDIDEIPFPDRSSIDIKSYKYNINNEDSTTLITSRGCPFSCTFCANNVWGKTIRLRSSMNIYEELIELIEVYGYRAFMFFDDTMTINKRRMMEICDLIKKLGIVYRCFIRSDTVDPEMLRSMRESGCVEVGLGVESGSQKILDIVKKGQSVEKNLQAIKMCHDVGLRVKGFFIIGLPGESHETVKETISFLDLAKLEDFDMTIFSPYPGSIIYGERDSLDINFEDNYEFSWYKGIPGSYRTTINTSSLTAEDILRYRDMLEGMFKSLT